MLLPRAGQRLLLASATWCTITYQCILIRIVVLVLEIHRKIIGKLEIFQE